MGCQWAMINLRQQENFDVAVIVGDSQYLP
jgi:hypothetical protein